MSEENKGGLIFEVPLEQDWEFMGTNTPAKDILFPGGKQTSDLSDGSHQYTRFFDPWSCVSNSLTSCVETVLNRMMEIDPSVKPLCEELGLLDEKGNAQLSFRALAVMSGTIPGQGNSQRAVAECARTQGLVGEKFWPTNDSMTQDEWYKPVPKEIQDKAKLFLTKFNLYHENLKWNYGFGVAVHSDLVEAFQYGAVQACVGSPYIYEDGKVVGSQSDSKGAGAIHNYNHAIQVNGHIAPVDLIRDSYEPFDKKFDCQYALGTPKLFTISVKDKKKINMFRIIKQASSPACYLHCLASGHLFGIADGEEVNGGELLKSFSGTYANANITVVLDDEFATYQHKGNIQTVLFNK